MHLLLRRKQGNSYGDLAIIIKSVFWISTVSIFFGALLILVFFRYGTIQIISTSTNMLNSIYTSSLSFIFGIIGFLIAVIVFLVQYTSSKYNTAELEVLPVFTKYFVATLAILLYYILYNFLTLFLERAYPYNLVSLIFSISLIIIIPTTIAFAYISTNTAVIFSLVSREIMKYITDNKFSIRQDSSIEVSKHVFFVNSLNKRLSFFTKNCIEAIEKDHDDILVKSLDSIRNITKHYLKESSDFLHTEDLFLKELNDQFSFIIEVGLKSYNQKILEYLAITLKNITLDIVLFRHNEEYSGKEFVFAWLDLMQNLFFNCFKKKRTNACIVCIKGIDEVFLELLNQKQIIRIDYFSNFLKDVYVNLINQDDILFTELLHLVYIICRNQFLKVLELAKQGSMVLLTYDIPSLFSQIAYLINHSKVKYDYSRRTNKIFSPFFGKPSFIEEVVNLDFSQVRNDEIQGWLPHFIFGFIDFYFEILSTESRYNPYDIFYELPSILLLISQLTNLPDGNRLELVEYLNSKHISYLIRKYSCYMGEINELTFTFIERSIDYFALLIYLYEDNSDIINKALTDFHKMYKLIKKKKSENAKNMNIIRLIYSELELISSWSNLYPSLKEKNISLIKTLKRDLSFSTFESSELPCFGGFPLPNYCPRKNNLIWQLTSLIDYTFIDKQFRESIANKLNNINGEHYRDFHEMLKEN